MGKITAFFFYLNGFTFEIVTLVPPSGLCAPKAAWGSLIYEWVLMPCLVNFPACKRRCVEIIMTVTIKAFIFIPGSHGFQFICIKPEELKSKLWNPFTQLKVRSALTI